LPLDVAQLHREVAVGGVMSHGDAADRRRLAG
jgi:hypothetical protein